MSPIVSNATLEATREDEGPSGPLPSLLTRQEGDMTSQVWLNGKFHTMPWTQLMSGAPERRLPESGVPYLIHPMVFLPNVPTLEHVTRGVRLSSNGLSLSGRCDVRADFGTSDPQEPQEPANFSATFCKYLYTLPVSDPRQMLSFREDEG